MLARYLMILLVASPILGEEAWLEAAREVLEQAAKDNRVDLASGLMAALAGSQGGSSDPLQSLLGGGGLASLLPALLSPGHTHSEDPNQDDHAAHDQHDQATQLIWTFIQSAWAKLSQSDFVRAMWQDTGLRQLMESWSHDNTGAFNPDKLFGALANPSFRRNWLAPVTTSIAHIIHNINNPNQYKRYLSNGVVAVNDMLRSQGIEEQDLLQPSHPLSESLPRLIDNLVNKQLGLQVSSAPYILPTINYFSELVKVGAGQSVNELEDRVNAGVNEEIVNPILRVHAAYSHAIRQPQCDEQIMCQINAPATDSSQIRPQVTKLSSLVASWFLSGHTGTPFLNLYGAVTAQHANCQVMYPGECGDWTDHNIKMDYEHNEL